MSRRVDLRPESLNLDRLAEHAMAAADALGWRRPFFLIGHSHGGGVAQVMAARYPERVAGLVLVATLGAPAHAKYRLLSLPFASAIARVMSRLFGVAVLRPLNRAIVRAVMSDLFSPQPRSSIRQNRNSLLRRTASLST
jgi:pimeloyl-ACP methyl ester carboxylesterase